MKFYNILQNRDFNHQQRAESGWDAVEKVSAKAKC